MIYAYKKWALIKQIKEQEDEKEEKITEKNCVFIDNYPVNIQNIDLDISIITILYDKTKKKLHLLLEKFIGDNSSKPHNQQKIENKKINRPPSLFSDIKSSSDEEDKKSDDSYLSTFSGPLSPKELFSSDGLKGKIKYSIKMKKSKRKYSIKNLKKRSRKIKSSKKRSRKSFKNE